MRSLLLVLALSFAASAPVQAASPTTTCSVSADLPAFTIQLASTTTHAAALRIARSVKGAWIATICDAGKTLFRVNYGRFDSRPEAVKGQWEVEDLMDAMTSAPVQDAGHVVRY